MVYFILLNSIKYIGDIFISHLIFNESATLKKLLQFGKAKFCHPYINKTYWYWWNKWGSTSIHSDGLNLIREVQLLLPFRIYNLVKPTEISNFSYWWNGLSKYSPSWSKEILYLKLNLCGISKSLKFTYLWFARALLDPLYVSIWINCI